MTRSTPSWRGTTIQRWLSAPPDDLVWSRRRLLLAQAQLAGTRGRLEETERLVDAAERASAGAAGEPLEPTSGRAGSLLVNVPAHIALDRAYLAQFRGDAEATAAFSTRALAECGEGEWLLSSTVQGFLAVAEWFRGRFAEAERAFVSGIAGGGSAASSPMPGGPANHSARFSVARAARTRSSGPASRRRRSPQCPAARRGQRPGRRTHAWVRWPTSGMSSTPRCGTSPRASRCAASSSMRRRWPPA